MTAWPFSLVWPSGLVNNDVPTHADLNKLDAQAAQGADGTSFTDVALVSNFTQPFTDTNGGALVLYNAFYQQFFSLRTPSADLLGYRMMPPFAVRTAETIPAGAGLHPKCGDVDPARGHMLVGGNPGSSSNLRYRVYDASGLGVWSAVASNKSAGTDGPLCAIYCGGTFDRWFTGYLDGTLESTTGTPGVPSTWGSVGAPNSFRRDAFAFSTSLHRLVVASQGNVKYLTCDDGVTFTERTAPTALQTVWWSSYRSKFYAVDSSTGFSLYSSADGITWTLVTGSLPQNFSVVQFFEYRRLIGCIVNGGALCVSLDGGVSWQIVAKFPTNAGDNLGTLAFRNDNAAQLVIAESTTGVHWASLRAGF